MTVIAYRAGVIASDSGVWCEDVLVGEHVKIHRLSDGRLFAGSGSSVDIYDMIEWLNDTSQPRPRLHEDPDHSLRAILVGPHVNDVFRFEGNRGPFDVGAIMPYHVIGAHTEFLLGALANGASAEKAIRLAIKYCSFAAGRVQVARL